MARGAPAGEGSGLPPGPALSWAASKPSGSRCPYLRTKKPREQIDSARERRCKLLLVQEPRRRAPSYQSPQKRNLKHRQS